MRVSGSPLGNPDTKLINEQMSVSTGILLIVKNAAIHFGIPPFSAMTNQVVTSLHNDFGAALDDPANNLDKIKFRLMEWAHDEDTASNFFQFVLGVLATAVVIVNFKKRDTKALLLIIFPLIWFLTLALVLKWNPWQTRIQCTLFFVLAISIGYVFFDSVKLPKSVLNGLSIVVGGIMIVMAIRTVMFDPLRPLKTSPPTTYKLGVSDSRLKKYFANMPGLETVFTSFNSFVAQHPKEVGLITTSECWEYPFYIDSYRTHSDILPALDVTNPSAIATWNSRLDSTRIKYIIAQSKSDSLTYNGSIFRPIDRHSYLSLYMKDGISTVSK